MNDAEYFKMLLIHVLENLEEKKKYGLVIKANNEVSNEVHNWWRHYQSTNK